MEQLITDILPDAYTWLNGYVVSVFGYMAAGVLIAFIFWALAFAIDAVYGWLRKSAEF